MTIIAGKPKPPSIVLPPVKSNKLPPTNGGSLFDDKNKNQGSEGKLVIKYCDGSKELYDKAVILRKVHKQYPKKSLDLWIKFHSKLLELNGIRTFEYSH
jgi:hypothetical protein